MASQNNETILFQGKVYSRKLIESFKFPVGCKFKYNNASYNDIFTVVSIRKDPGAEYRQVVGAIAGEVWMLLTTLQREAADGAVTFTDQPSAQTPSPKEAIAAKKQKKTKTSKKSKKKA